MQPGPESQVLLSIGVLRILNGGGTRGGGWAWGTEVPKWGPEAKPRRGSGGRSPPEAEAKCEISVQFLTFSCIKF